MPTPEPTWKLVIYVAGDTPRSAKAIANLRALCDARLDHLWAIEVVDLAMHPERASADQILATPTIVRRSPGPLRKLVGDVSSPAVVIEAFDLPEDGGAE